MKARIKVGWDAYWEQVYAGLQQPRPPLPASLSEGAIVDVVEGSVSNKADDGRDLGGYFADIVGSDGRTASIQVKLLERIEDAR